MHPSQVKAASRRSKVATIYLRGTTNQYEILAQLGMEPSQQPIISQDLKELNRQWRQSGIRDIDAAKGMELDRIDLVEQTAWQSWESSKTVKQSTRAKRRSRAGQDDQPTVLSDETEEKREQRDGDPRYLAIVLECVQKRIDILGLDMPVVDMSKYVTTEQVRSLANAIMRAVRTEIIDETVLGRIKLKTLMLLPIDIKAIEDPPIETTATEPTDIQE